MMLSYHEAEIWMQVVFLTIQFLTLCTGVCLIPSSLKGRAILPKLLVPLGILVSGGMLTTLSSEIRAVKTDMPSPEVTKWLSEKPLLLSALVILAVIAYFLYYILSQRQLKNSNITRASIKESVDKLPAGLCFYYESGRCVLTNHKMLSLSHSITGCSLQNAAELWSVLQNGEILPNVKRLSYGDGHSFLLPDGSVWSFARERVQELYQLTAVEVTSVWQITEELKLKNQELDSINKRLRQYGESVDELTRAKERLETKANIHRELGRALLVNRRFVLGSGGSEAPFSTWEAIVAILRSESSFSEEDSLAVFLRAAEQARVKLEIVGEFPENADVKALFVKAAVESLVNAVRHAEATKLCIHLSSDSRHYSIRFTNNGKKPDGPITEGGGLGSLRRKISLLGGSMSVCIDPEFSLTISVPTERSEPSCIAY